MKRVVSIVAFCLIFLFSLSQNFEITFQPGIGTLPIDSIQATNLRTSQTVNITGNGNAVLNNKTTSVLELIDSENKYYIYPNPTFGNSEVYFSNLNRQKVGIHVYASSGELLHDYYQLLEKGDYRIQVSFPYAGVFYVSVYKDGSYKSLKVLNLGNRIQNCIISLHEGVPDMISDISHKSAVSDEGILEFSDGDVILYLVYSGENTTVITDVPTGSKVIEVDFFECKDPDNRSYKVVQIGDQWWMAENLAHLPSVSPFSQSSSNVAYYYVYGNNDTDINRAKATVNYRTFGVLYNWPAAMANAGSSNNDPSGVKGICPTGWHLPSDGEWTKLGNYLSANGFNYDGTVGSGWNKIAKSLAAQNGWNTYTTPWSVGAIGNDLSANNKSGFSALPGGGLMIHSAAADNVGFDGGWWTSTEYNTNLAWHYDLQYWNSDLKRFSDGKMLPFYVRCIKDIETTAQKKYLPVKITYNINELIMTNQFKYLLNESGEVSKIFSKFESDEKKTSASVHLEYDPSGRVVVIDAIDTVIIDNGDPRYGSERRELEYDSLNRLSQVLVYFDGDVNAGIKLFLTYNSEGQLTVVKEVEVDESFYDEHFYNIEYKDINSVNPSKFIDDYNAHICEFDSMKRPFHDLGIINYVPFLQDDLGFLELSDWDSFSANNIIKLTEEPGCDWPECSEQYSFEYNNGGYPIRIMDDEGGEIIIEYDWVP